MAKRQTKVERQLNEMLMDVICLQDALVRVKSNLEQARENLRLGLKLAAKPYHVFLDMEAKIVSEVVFAWQVDCLKEKLTRSEFEKYCPRQAKAPALRRACNDDPAFAARVKTCKHERPRENLIADRIVNGKEAR